MRTLIFPWYNISMHLENMLKQYVESLGPVRYSKSFGWFCIFTGRNLFAGYRIVDDDILILWLILSPSGFGEAMDNGFQKFVYGKTWAETEMIGEEDIRRVIPFLADALEFSRTRIKPAVQKPHSSKRSST
jgi:hypothetical protein